LKERLLTDAPESAPAQETWDANAEFWLRIIREHRDRYRTELTDSAVMDAIGDVTDQDVLDVGCGEGYTARALARRGARQVNGIDSSREQVKAAEAALIPGTAFSEANAGDLPFPAESFDLVLANHVLNDLPDIAGPISEIARVLRPGGRFVALMLHPCFYEHNAERAPGSRMLSAAEYFTRRGVEQPFEVDGLTSPAASTSWVRPLEAYTEALTGSGLVITRLTEPHPSDEQMASSHWWQENFSRPLFLLVTARKPPRSTSR
jgi:2-polyprenyl-3-methyl-5-hydroxy-6-metoxy-1,4-benzoquinol methylase